MNDLQPRDPDRAVGDVLPQRPPEPAPVPHANGGIKRYLAPLLLASIALAVNILAFLAPDPLAPTPEATIEKAEMSVDQKIKAAEQLKAHGDQLYEEGYSWVNDNDKLQGAQAAYFKSWELITGEKHPFGGNEKDLIADTVQCSLLQQHLQIRLHTLSETFARNKKISEYIP